jgi:PleD family two-component response regulator
MAKTRQKILIAYDRPDAIDALKNLLSQYDITTAADPHEVARLAAQEDFALVITEYVVPSVSGAEFITGKNPQRVSNDHAGD